MILWFHELFCTLSEEIWMSLLTSLSKRPPSSQRSSVMNPPHPHRPVLPSFYRLSHAELSDCIVLSQIINTQDHQCSHLWAASFGAIASMLMFSEKSSAVQRGMSSEGLLWCAGIQPKGSNHIWAQQALWMELDLFCLFCYIVSSYIVEMLVLSRVSPALCRSVAVMLIRAGPAGSVQSGFSFLGSNCWTHVLTD